MSDLYPPISSPVQDIIDSCKEQISACKSMYDHDIIMYSKGKVAKKFHQELDEVASRAQNEETLKQELIQIIIEVIEEHQRDFAEITDKIPDMLVESKLKKP